jgi:hypothetical protein
MQKATHHAYRFGCLISVLAPLLGVLLYPRARWLFAFVLLGVALVVLEALNQKDTTPHEIGALADRLLNGTSAGWDVDHYEHLNPKDPQVRELWEETMEMGSLPEEWPKLDDATKNKMRELIRSIRGLGDRAGS